MIAALSLLVLLVMAAVALVNLIGAPRLHRMPTPGMRPRVSLLVPARNEEVNLRETLPALLAVDYENLEVLVLDDASEDGTARVVEAHLAGDSAGRLRLLRGRPLPAGWLGKNWACHQLAGAATGDVLIFCDADVTVGAEAVLHTVAALERYAAGAATALPRQRFEHWLAAAVVPLVVQVPVLATLPLPLVPRTRPPSLAMGNGQWLAFTRECYEAVGGHASVRGEVVEDVALARRVKRCGQRLVVALAARDLQIAMYRGAAAVREGFGKNLYALAGSRPLALLAVLSVFVLAAVVPWVGVLAGSGALLAPLVLLILIRASGALLLGGGGASVLLHPIGSVLVPALALESMLRSGRGVTWKGRVVTADAAAGLAGTGAGVDRRG